MGYDPENSAKEHLIKRKGRDGRDGSHCGIKGNTIGKARNGNGDGASDVYEGMQK